MKECSPGDDRREISSWSQVRSVGSIAPQAAAETMHKLSAVSRRMRYASSAIEKIVQAASNDRDLTLAHWLILVHLSQGCSCKQSDLYGATGIATGYLTRLLDDLDAKGMVCRRRSLEDRRQILLSLTDRGRDAALALLAAIDPHRLHHALDQLQASLDSFLLISAPRAPARKAQRCGK